MSKKILKRSLALGALMAFVITGNVSAERLLDNPNGTAQDPVTKAEAKYNDCNTTTGSGGAVNNSGVIVFDKCEFNRNILDKATAQGGAIYNTGNLTVTNSEFIGNEVKGTGRAAGAAIYSNGGEVTVDNCYFSDNVATGKPYMKKGKLTTDNAYGSVIGITGGCIATIKNSWFEANKGGTSNGLVHTYAGSKMFLEGNTFIDNDRACVNVVAGTEVTLSGINTFENNTSNSIINNGTATFTNGSKTYFDDNTANYDFGGKGNFIIENGAYVESEEGITTSGDFKVNGKFAVGDDSEITNFSGTNGTFEFLKPDIKVDVTKNTSTGLNFVADGTVNDAVNGDINKLIGDDFAANGVADFSLEEGTVVGAVEGTLEGEEVEDDEGKKKFVYRMKTSDEKPHEGNAAISHNANIAMMAWRAETNDMNKRLGELRNANGDLGVWVRMVGGEDEFKSVEYDYTQYQLGYDEKLSVDPSWTVGVALSYTDGESNFTDGSGENTHKGLSVYGSKLNDDGSFIDLIAKYSRLEHDLTSNSDKGDYSTNGYSVSAEYGKRFQQGKGLWIEPQVELTYGKVKSAEYKLGDKTVSQDAMESLVGRIGFSLGKDIKQGNVYARASYLYDFEGKTNMAFANSGARREFKYDLGGGWWEVGVGANINLSKATYIYADIEKTFGGEVDTNWQWNLGVRYSF